MARYADAIAWIAANDDNDWLEDPEPIASVSAALVADVWRKSTDEVEQDIRDELRRQRNRETPRPEPARMSQ